VFKGVKPAINSTTNRKLLVSSKKTMTTALLINKKPTTSLISIRNQLKPQTEVCEANLSLVFEGL
jgi:hypothetical protein